MAFTLSNKTIMEFERRYRKALKHENFKAMAQIKKEWYELPLNVGLLDNYWEAVCMPVYLDRQYENGLIDEFQYIIYRCDIKYYGHLNYAPKKGA